MRMNVTSKGSGSAVLTHEGAPAVKFGPLRELKRAVLTALLWEDTFYEKGSSIAQRIADLVPQCRPEDVAALAIEARERMYLRHVPLFLVYQLTKVKGQGPLVADTLARVIQRPDELGEYLAIYWEGQPTLPKRPRPVSAGSKRGLARAFRKFNEYALAKYDRDSAIKLRDVLRITHAKPRDTEQAAMWKRVISRELATPDTWEVALSAGANKRETFERLLREDKLGGLAFLRNLRNMEAAGVDRALIKARCESGSFDKVLPFRFVAAAKHAPGVASWLDLAMQRACVELPRLTGTTVVLVDVSGSMDANVSGKSELNRIDAAAALAVYVREIAEDARVFTFSDDLVEVANYRGLSMIKGIHQSQAHGSTYMGGAIKRLNHDVRYDRLIVITDEQSHDQVPSPKGKGYIVNVAPYQHGVGFGDWVRISGWSEHVLDFVREVEADA